MQLRQEFRKCPSPKQALISKRTGQGHNSSISLHHNTTAQLKIRVETVNAAGANTHTYYIHKHIPTALDARTRKPEIPA